MVVVVTVIAPSFSIKGERKEFSIFVFVGGPVVCAGELVVFGGGGYIRDLCREQQVYPSPLSPVSCSPTKTDGVDLDAASLNSVQFEEDFNSRTKNLGSGVGVGVGGYLGPDHFLYHLTVIKRTYFSILREHFILFLVTV